MNRHERRKEAALRRRELRRLLRNVKPDEMFNVQHGDPLRLAGLTWDGVPTISRPEVQAILKKLYPLA